MYFFIYVYDSEKISNRSLKKKKLKQITFVQLELLQNIWKTLYRIYIIYTMSYIIYDEFCNKKKKRWYDIYHVRDGSRYVNEPAVVRVLSYVNFMTLVGHNTYNRVVLFFICVCTVSCKTKYTVWKYFFCNCIKYKYFSIFFFLEI